MTSNNKNQRKIEQEITSQFSVESEDPVEEKVEIKEVKKSQEPESQRVLLNNTDAYIHDRMKSQPRSLEEIEVVAEQDNKANYHQLTLPKEIKKYEDRFRFRWLSKDKRQIDHACDVRGWVIVNRLYFDELPDHIFTVTGSIERGDNILAFIRKDIGEQMFKEPGKKSKDIVEGMLSKHKDDPRYYTPKEGNDNVIQI